MLCLRACVHVHVHAVYTGYPSKCRVCIGNCLGRFMPMYSVWCRPGVHWWSIHMASLVTWIRQLSGASLDLSHSQLVRYRCYKRKSVGAYPVHLQICVLLLRRAYTYMVCTRVCACAYRGCCTRNCSYDENESCIYFPLAVGLEF